MKTIDLVKKLENSTSGEIKDNIEYFMLYAFQLLQTAKDNIQNRRYDLVDINQIQNFFDQHSLNKDELIISNKYLRRYVESVQRFWNSYEYNPGMRVTYRYNVFAEIEKLKLSNESRTQFVADITRMQSNMEECLIASNQIYTKFRLELIRAKILVIDSKQ